MLWLSCEIAQNHSCTLSTRILSCWMMKNLLEIWWVAHNNYCNNRGQNLWILALGSTLGWASFEMLTLSWTDWTMIARKAIFCNVSSWLVAVHAVGSFGGLLQCGLRDYLSVGEQKRMNAYLFSNCFKWLSHVW